MDISKSFDRYIQDREALGVSPRHVYQLRAKFKQMCEFFTSHSVTDTAGLNNQVAVQFLHQYVSATKSDGSPKYSSWYVNGMAKIMRAYLRYLYEVQIITQPIPFKLPKLRKPVPSSIDAKLLQELIDKIPEARIRLLLLFFFDSALRLAEVAGLTWGCISFEKGTVFVEHGKGNKFRYVPIGKTILRLLVRYKGEIEDATGAVILPSDPLFANQNGTHYSISGLTSLFSRLSKRYHIPLSAHMLRRGAAKAMWANGRDLLEIQQALGHTSVEITRHYIGYLSQDDVQKARESSPVDRAIRVRLTNPSRMR